MRLTPSQNKNKIETLDAAPLWRQSGAMITDSKTDTIGTLDRINLRLSGQTFNAIDAARGERPGIVSRNTWITEAIHEKLARVRVEDGLEEGFRRNG